MNIFLTNMLYLSAVCRHPTFYKNLAFIQIVDKSPFVSIVEVAKMVPASLPFNQKDPWWLIRDNISPVAFIIAPQFGFVARQASRFAIAILDKAVSTFPEASDTTPFIIVVLAVFTFLVMTQP